MFSYNDEARHKGELMWSNLFWLQRKKEEEEAEEDLHFFQLSKYCLQPEFTFRSSSKAKMEVHFHHRKFISSLEFSLEIRFDNAMSTRSNVMEQKEKLLHTRERTT